jgi:pyruvate decarboxylase
MLPLTRIGDYNLQALDYLPKCGLSWVGNCNELNAGMRIRE